ncbi:unnamed protein product [Meloidogyne enterolobii]|uniref:Uncharacterized protein n=1 Tax=Meloidogyne enterolobii TaxID=390850 RepID=A0ACB0YQ53_MELEN
MFSLPTEVQLDVLKCFNFNQLFAVKQTNFYFCNLINKYEGELARKKFSEISIFELDSFRMSNIDKLLELESGVFEVTLNDQLKKKWQTAIDKSTPLFLNNSGPDRELMVTIEKTFINLSDTKSYYILKLPNSPKNFKEMIIIRCWLQHLFNCAFEFGCFDKSIFNPEMINILFDNDKTSPPKFNIQGATLYASNKTFQNVLRTSLNHLTISTCLYINLQSVDITEQHTDILFNILINEGNKFSKIYFTSSKLTRLHDLILKVGTLFISPTPYFSLNNFFSCYQTL